MIKTTLEDYAVQVINPHLKGLVREVRSREYKSKKRILIYVALDPEDHARATQGRPDELDLSALAGAIIASLAKSRFGYRCSVRIRST
jgi:hypothetical protein